MLRLKEGVRSSVTVQFTYILLADDEVQAKLADAEQMQASLRDEVMAKGAQLADAVTVAEKFDNEMRDLVQLLRDAKDNLLSQDTPGIEAATVEEQLRELQVSALLLGCQCCQHFEGMKW